MGSLQTWIILFCCTLARCAPLIYTGKPLVLPESHPNVHLYLEEGAADIIISEFASPRPPIIYPMTPQEMEELYLKLSERPHNSSKYLQYISGGKLKSYWRVLDGKKCCGNEWVDYGAYGGHQYEAPKPVFQLGYGYPSNQIQEYRNSDVKPVTEHIEGDLKYDFRTNTHSI